MVGNQEDRGVTADAAALAPFGLSPSGSSAKLPAANASTLIELAKHCMTGRGVDDALDVLIEIALFEPNEDWAAIRANSAGTKVIYTRADGSQGTFRAFDWTMDRNQAAARLSLRAHEQTEARS